MEKKVFIGADVSKKTIDICCIEKRLTARISNDQEGFVELLHLLSKKGLALEGVWMVFEHTGIYSSPLLSFCSITGITYSQVPGLAIKKSSGIVRGKSDKIDARRICEYAIEKHEKLVPGAANIQSIETLKRLINLRDKLVVQRAGFESYVGELKEVLNLNDASLEINAQETIIKELKNQIAKIEQEINNIIKQDSTLKRNFDLLTSIVGVGFVIALYTIVYTDNFTKFATSRKFSCYCGTAPFAYDSGTSVKKRTKVSHLANKKLKSLLEMGARSAIQYDPELRLYYLNRVEKGKNKTSTLNVVRNKLIGRMFAVINNQQPYQVKFAA